MNRESIHLIRWLARVVIDFPGKTLRKIMTYQCRDVFAWSQLDLGNVEKYQDGEIRRLTHEDFDVMRSLPGRLGEQANLYYVKRGIDNAYGLFLDGKLVHVSWVFTKDEYTKQPVESFRLNAGEAELVNCWTEPDYRGKGFYPMTICVASKELFDNGFDRVYMAIERDNQASRSGIVKAGLKPYGRTHHFFSPLLKSWRGWYRVVAT